MPPKFQLQPIAPKKPITSANSAAVFAAMRDYGADVVHHMQADYGKVPASASYRRTGNLGRAWAFEGPKARGPDLVLDVGNNKDYAGRVQGFKTVGEPRQRQTRLQARRGWSSLEDAAKNIFNEHRAAIEKALT